MFEFLQLLLLVLCWSVVEAKWIPAARALSPALGITSHVAGSILEDDADAAEFHTGHECKDLEKGGTRGGRDGLQWVGSGEGVRSSPVVASEVSNSGNNETDNGNLRDSAVHQLSFAVPSQAIDGGVSGEKLVEVGGNRIGPSGEVAGVETDVTNQRSIKESRGRFSWDSSRGNSTNLQGARHR